MEVSTFTPSTVGRVVIRGWGEGGLNREELFHAGGNEVGTEDANDQRVNGFDVLDDQIGNVLDDAMDHLADNALTDDLIEYQVLMETTHDGILNPSSVETIAINVRFDENEVVDPLSLSIDLFLRESGSIDLDRIIISHDVQSVAGAI